MRSIFKITMVVLMVGFVSQAWAQDSNKTLLQTEKMAQKLGLDEQQKAALDKELKAAREERKESMERMRALREEMKRDAFVARQAQMEKLKEILTDEQWEQLKAEKQEAFKNRRQFRGQRGPQNRPEITDAQRLKAKKFMMKKRMDRRKAWQKDAKKKEDGGK